MKKRTFFAGLVGLATGVVLAQNWRVVTKEGIKFGIKAGRKINELSQQAMEDVGDLAAEATQELSEHDREVM
ncbi:MAG TPA: hypothetical protein VM934_05795 [Pyrinomonadaceae bacterium]|jgi:hypothetical protein|nr:hypothetical protein [Pyrinomonadaceae bacterium]